MFWQLGHATNMDVMVDFKAFDLSKRDSNLRCLWDIHLDIQIDTCSRQLKQKGSGNSKRKNQKSSSLGFVFQRWEVVIGIFLCTWKLFQARREMRKVRGNYWNWDLNRWGRWANTALRLLNRHWNKGGKSGVLGLEFLWGLSSLLRETSIRLAAEGDTRR